MDQNELKSLVGKKSVEWIKDGMTVGLGTGSTVYYMVEELGRRAKDENLKITGVTTSIRTANQAESLGIPLKSVDTVDHIDITISRNQGRRCRFALRKNRCHEFRQGDVDR